MLINILARLFQHFPIPLELPAFADMIANLAQSTAIKQVVQASKGNPIPVPLQVLEQGSLLSAIVPALAVLPSKGLEKQDSDEFTSSSSDKVILNQNCH